MDCNQLREMLPLHVYGDLSADQAVAVERHLEQWSGCRAEAVGLGQVRHGLGASLATDVSRDLPRLYRQAAEHVQKRVRRWRMLAVAGLSLAAALLIAFLLRVEVHFD